MKKRNLSHGALAASVCLLATISANAAPQNLITNGNFEQVKNDQAAGWNVPHNPDVVENSFPIEKDFGHVALIRFLTWDAHGAYFTQSVAVKPHTQYRFSLKARMDTGNIRIAISGGDGKDKVNVVEYGRAAHLSMYPLFWDEAWSKYLVFTPNEWRPMTIDFNSRNATSVYVSFGAYQRAGTYSFDDVSLQKISSDTN
jgi:hypothetical protein